MVRQAIEQVTPAGLPATLRLLRLSNSLPAAALVLIGARLAVGRPLPASAWLAAAAMWCITAYGYVANDLADVAEDRINKPDRPLPSGAVQAETATRLAWGLAGCGALLAAGVGLAPLGVALLVIWALHLYNKRLKGRPGSGNVLIAFLAGCTLPVGSVAVQGIGPAALTPVWLPALLLSAFVAAREVIKTVEDVAGDRAAGRRTLPVRYGLDRTVQIVAGLAVLVAVLSIAPIPLAGYSWPYLLCVTAGVTAPLVYTAVTLQRTPTPAHVSRCLALLKSSYFAGILALLLA